MNDSIQISVFTSANLEGFWEARASIDFTRGSKLCSQTVPGTHSSRSRNRAISYALTEAALLIERGQVQL